MSSIDYVPNDFNHTDLSPNLERYRKAKRRAMHMANYILKNYSQVNFLKTEALRVKSCGSYLVFKQLLKSGSMSLKSANFCEKSTLCPFCAIRRASKLLANFEKKSEFLLSEHPSLKAYMVTLTVKNQPSLSKAYNQLTGSLKKMRKDRQHHLKNPKRKFIEFVKAKAGVYSIEFKRGKNSQAWHPNAHMIWFCSSKPDKYQLSEEWKKYTKDSYIVDVRPVKRNDDKNPYLEVFKYALKFSELSLEDNFEAYRFLKGKRLVGTFGLLRGIKLDEEVAIEELEDYIELFYRYVKGRYVLTKKTKVSIEEQKNFYFKKNA